MRLLRRIKRFFTDIIQRIKMERAYRKKLTDIKKRDPFIYK